MRKKIRVWIERKDGINQRYTILRKRLSVYRNNYFAYEQTVKIGKRKYTRMVFNREPEIEEMIEEEPLPAEFTKYVYILSFDYEKVGKKGRHPIHIEIRMESPTPMTEAQIWDYIISRETELPVSHCGMKIKGEEIEYVENEVTKDYEILSWTH